MNYSPVSGSVNADEKVSKYLYWIFIYFTIDFFIHLSARIPGYGVIRPTFLLTIILSVMLFSQSDKFRGYTDAPAFKIIIWLLIFIVVSLPFVTWPGSVLKENIPEFIKAVSFFFFAALILDSEKRLKTFLVVFLTCQVLRVLEPLYLHIAYDYWGDYTHLGHGEFAGRLSGAPADVVNPNGLGFIIATAAPFLYYLLWRSRSKVAALLFLVLFPMLLYALVLTMSRGAFLAMLVVGWMIFKESRKKLSLIIVVLLGAAFLWSNMTPIQKDRYLSIFGSDTAQSVTARGRLHGMVEEFRLGMHRPLFGHGLGTTSEAKANILGWSRAAHNLYAELMIEIGLIGMFIFLKYMRAIYKAIRQNDEIMKSVGDEYRLDFSYRLNQALVTVFWMYVVFSMSYWGLSVYYWYLFGGLTVAFSRVYFNYDEQGSIPVASADKKLTA